MWEGKISHPSHIARRAYSSYRFRTIKLRGAETWQPNCAAVPLAVVPGDDSKCHKMTPEFHTGFTLEGTDTYRGHDARSAHSSNR
jgi:hypothetical protein